MLELTTSGLLILVKPSTCPRDTHTHRCARLHALVAICGYALFVISHPCCLPCAASAHGCCCVPRLHDKISSGEYEPELTKEAPYLTTSHFEDYTMRERLQQDLAAKYGQDFAKALLLCLEERPEHRHSLQQLVKNHGLMRQPGFWAQQGAESSEAVDG